ncbi:MAG: arylsulfatase [Planctomycetaceae bacterium]|jgi:arylsulfatase A-like enzyme|nr:arylsulfatase [Planctomycetaceae bacterium]
MKISFLWSILFILSGTLLFAAEKPNIVIFLADDLGWADVGWHGKEVKTPNLDKLADSGLKLEQFYVQPVCTPTRASLMTGRYTIRYGLQTGVIRPWANHGLASEEQTLANVLHNAGYYTAITGKWHLGHVKKEYQPLQRGFDYHYGLYNGAMDYYTHYRDGALDWHRNGAAVREEGYSTDLLADDAARIIKEHNTEKPLFLYVPFNAVHGPYQKAPNEEINAQYKSLPGTDTRRTYAGMVTVMDAAVGRVIKALDDKGIRDNTLIFFSSDNGGPNPKKTTDNGELRAGKGTLYEGGVRVPAFIVWNGKIKANSVSNELIHITDLYPTLLNIVGASTEQRLPLDGVNQRDTILEGKASARKELLHNAYDDRGAVRVGSWKLVLTNLDKPNQAKQELFNLADDPNEKNDLAAAQPEKLKELLERYRFYAKQAVPALISGDPPKGYKNNVPKVWGDFD